MKKHIVTTRPSFQGDLAIWKIDTLPKGLTKADPENGRFILAHSEKGHHHVVLERGAQMLIDQTNAFIAYLDIAEETEIQHLRAFDTHEPLTLPPVDTHEPLTLPPGLYEVHRQQEHSVEGWRRAAD